MHYRERERRGGAAALYILALLGVFLLAGSASFIAFGGLGALPFLKKAPVAYYAAGPVRALRLAAPEATDEASLAAYFAEAAAFAEENGFNTILYQGKSGLTVQWRDDIFPFPEGMDAADTRRHKTDPLALLCAALEGRPIQLWLEAAPYAGGTAPAGSTAKAAALAQAGGAFSAANEAYAGLLVESLAALPRTYPLAGLVLGGFEGEAEAGFDAGFHAMVEALHAGLASTGRLLPLGLALPESGGKISLGAAQALQSEGYVTYLLPALAGGEEVFEQAQALGRVQNGLVPELPVGGDALALFAAGRSLTLDGVVLGSYPRDKGDAGRYALMLSALEAPEGAQLPGGFEIPTLLSVNYPAQNARVTVDTLYVMGYSNPALPLLLNGAEVASRAEGGSFGVAVSLEIGENSFVFSQGDKALTLQIERHVPEGGGGAAPSDGSTEAPVGQVMRVNAVIAGALTNVDDDGSMNETLVRGATFTVQDNAATMRGGRRTWAYQMESGDWVLAQNCEWVNAPAQSAFTGIGAAEGEGGEWLSLEGGGSPAAYVAYDQAASQLNLTFYSTGITLPEGFSSRLVSGASLSQNEDGSVTLSLAVNDIWGYSIEYPEGGTRIFLKDPPRRSADPAKPLAGVRIMLDAGHGGTDIGAPGLAGEGSGGPNEKHLNLALTQCIAYRLRQLGATVLYTREDDSALSLDERLAMQIEQKPDFFISVHHNSVELNADRSEVKGVESYYFHPYSIPPSGAFAQNLAERVSAATGRTLRKDAEWTYFYVTRTTVCPSVLFEFGFVINPWEFEDIASAEGMYASAFAVADAVMDTLPG